MMKILKRIFLSKTESEYDRGYNAAKEDVKEGYFSFESLKHCHEISQCGDPYDIGYGHFLAEYEKEQK